MSFNVICNSNDALEGDGEYNLSYQFDWNSIPEGEYEMSWSFRQIGVEATPIADVFENSIQAISLPDLGIKNSYRCAATQSSAITSGIIGFCQQTVVDINTQTISLALWNDNPPVKMSRPNASVFRVHLLATDLTLAADYDKAYTLILHFKKC